MNHQSKIQLNIENLKTFWSACGMTTFTTPNNSTLHTSTSWPNRVWFDFEDDPTDADMICMFNQIEQVDEPFKAPFWHADNNHIHDTFVNNGYEIGMTQELMGMKINQDTFLECTLDLKDVRDEKSSELWASIAGDSFGYPIHSPVILGLVDLPGFHLSIAYDNDTPVGTGLLVQTANIAGIHMIGVPPAHRRKGYARQIMHGLLNRAAQMGCDSSTLQASAAGASLYLQLGYESHGPIHTYRKKQEK